MSARLPQLRVERPEHEVERLESRGIHVARAIHEHVHLDRSQDAEWIAAVFRARSVAGRPTSSLWARELGLVHAMGDPQALRVVGARDERPPECSPRPSPISDRGSAPSLSVLWTCRSPWGEGFPIGEASSARRTSAYVRNPRRCGLGLGIVSGVSSSHAWIMDAHPWTPRLGAP